MTSLENQIIVALANDDPLFKGDFLTPKMITDGLKAKIASSKRVCYALVQIGALSDPNEPHSRSGGVHKEYTINRGFIKENLKDFIINRQANKELFKQRADQEKSIKAKLDGYEGMKSRAISGVAAAKRLTDEKTELTNKIIELHSHISSLEQQIENLNTNIETINSTNDPKTIYETAYQEARTDLIAELKAVK